MHVRVWRMRSGISITVDRTARLRLVGVVRDRNAAQKHVGRAAIVLLSADPVESFFAKLTRRRLKRGVFHSLVDLQAAINRVVTETNE